MKITTIDEFASIFNCMYRHLDTLQDDNKNLFPGYTGLGWNIDFVNTSRNMAKNLSKKLNVEKEAICCANDYFLNYINKVVDNTKVRYKVYVAISKKEDKDKKHFYTNIVDDFAFCTWIENENGLYLCGDL